MLRVPNMKTGIGNGDEPDLTNFMRLVVSLMKVFMKHAVLSSERYVKICNRKTITEKDIVLALKYEAHEFFSKDFDADFFVELQEENNHSYLTDEEEDEGEEDEGEENGEEENEGEENGEESEDNYDEKTLSSEDISFRNKVLQYAQEWDAWNPDDPVIELIKKSINKTSENI